MRSQALPDAPHEVNAVASSSGPLIGSQEAVAGENVVSRTNNDPAFNPSSSQAFSQPLGEGGDDEPVDHTEEAIHE